MGQHTTDSGSMLVVSFYCSAVFSEKKKKSTVCTGVSTLIKWPQTIFDNTVNVHKKNHILKKYRHDLCSTFLL